MDTLTESTTLSEALVREGFNAIPFQAGGGVYTVAVYEDGVDAHDSHGQYDYSVFIGAEGDGYTADVFDGEYEFIEVKKGFESREGESAADFVRRLLRFRAAVAKAVALESETSVPHVVVEDGWYVVCSHAELDKQRRSEDDILYSTDPEF